MFKLLISDKMLPEVLEHAKQQEGVEVTYEPEIDVKRLTKIIPEYDALIVRSRTQVTQKILQAGTRLKVVGRAGVGTDNIDATAARAQGIEVLNTPEATSNSVAEHTIALMFALARQIARADASLKAGKWGKSLFMGSELSGKALGIIGLGRIGSRVAQKAKALGMRVVVYDRRQKTARAGDFAVFTSLATFLREIDYLSVHLPLNENTKNLITRKEFSKLKPTCFVINCSRGGIVNERDLIWALKRRRIAGAAVDVFDTEPTFNRTLVGLPNVVATPHIAASTVEAQLRCGYEIINKVIELFKFRNREQKTHGLPHLEIVPTDHIQLHEYFDKRRVGPLARKMTRDGVFTNPPLVMVISRGTRKIYLILDGSNRIKALKKLKVKHALVQIVDYLDPRVLLKRWNHAFSGIPRKVFLKRLASIPGFVRSPVSLEEAMGHLRDRSWACAVVIDEHSVYGIIAPKNLKVRLERLNGVVNLYHNKVKIRRIEVQSLDAWSDVYQQGQVIVLFPEFSKSEMLDAAHRGWLFPSGVTRHLIPQRVLSVNVPLQLLKKNMPLKEKNEWLAKFVQDRLRAGSGLRYYEESIFVFD